MIILEKGDVLCCTRCGHSIEAGDDLIRRWRVTVSAKGNFLSDPRLRIRCSACGTRGGDNVIIKKGDEVKILGGQEAIDREEYDREWEREQARQQEAWNDRYGNPYRF